MTRTAPEIDFTVLPLDEAASLLQAVGLELLRRALLGPASGERPHLADLLPDAQARKLAPRRLGFRLASPGYRLTLARALEQGLSEREWGARVWGQLRERLGARTLGYVPDALWPTVAERAWNSPAFQREAALLARGILQEQYLFSPGGLPLPIFATGTYWTLLLLAELPRRPAIKPLLRGLFRLSMLRSPARLAAQVGRIRRAAWARIPRTRWTWLPTARARRYRAAAHLRQRAEAQVLASEHWAGFWDQYVMTQAMLLWHGGAPASGGPLTTALSALPVVQDALRHVSSQHTGARRSHRTAPSAAPPPLLAHPTWESDRPPWLAGQYEPAMLVGG